MDGSSIYRLTAAALGTELDGELMVVQIDDGVFFSLKETSVAIWRLIDGSHSVDDIIAILSGEYDVEHAVCRAQVATFLTDLERSRLVVQRTR